MRTAGGRHASRSGSAERAWAAGFGASAPYQELYRHFGITPEAAVAAAKGLLG
ncbi:MAG: hypothetical protein ACOZJZ_07915 [Pseudomonadota bacterium]